MWEGLNRLIEQKTCRPALTADKQPIQVSLKFSLDGMAHRFQKISPEGQGTRVSWCKIEQFCGDLLIHHHIGAAGCGRGLSFGAELFELVQPLCNVFEVAVRVHSPPEGSFLIDVNSPPVPPGIPPAPSFTKSLQLEIGREPSRAASRSSLVSVVCAIALLPFHE